MDLLGNPAPGVSLELRIIDQAIIMNGDTRSVEECFSKGKSLEAHSFIHVSVKVGCVL